MWRFYYSIQPYEYMAACRATAPCMGFNHQIAIGCADCRRSVYTLNPFPQLQCLDCSRWILSGKKLEATVQLRFQRRNDDKSCKVKLFEVKFQKPWPSVSSKVVF